ncbi:MAG: DUF1902 domain-containing protein [Pseudomonadota bacterium]
MPTNIFEVRAVWDDEAQVWITDSNIVGLHVEAETLEEFEALVFEHARDMIFANHVSDEAFATTAPRDLIPAIVLKEPRAA